MLTERVTTAETEKKRKKENIVVFTRGGLADSVLIYGSDTRWLFCESKMHYLTTNTINMALLGKKNAYLTALSDNEHESGIYKLYTIILI